MRINKYLASCGFGSRRKTEELIIAGNVKVNGRIVTDLAYRISDADTVTCQNKPAVPANRLYYIMLNKPAGYVTTLNDEKGRATVMDLIPEKYRRAGVFPVGRLDLNTEGLLLFTNDGSLANFLCSPKNKVEKAYFAELDRALEAQDKKKLEAGIFLHQLMLKTRRSKIEAHPLAKNHIKITITEGKKRQIRYMFKAFGYNILRLRRISYGPLYLKGLPKGRMRELRDKEIRLLKALEIPLSSDMQNKISDYNYKSN